MTSSASTSSAAFPGKRGASPTELLKEDKQGEVVLSKRPSIKRKHRNGDVRADVRYHMRVTSSGRHAGGVSALSSRAMPP
jgi:protein-tyrosine phosphatase